MAKGYAVLQLPENYSYFRMKKKQNEKIIPDSAQNADSPGIFLSTVVDHHFQNYLKENPNSKFNNVKKLEKSINNSTSVESEDFKLKSKIDLAKISAEIELQYLLSYRIWFEQQFREFNAEVKLYEINNSQIALEHKSNSQESATSLGLRYNWWFLPKPNTHFPWRKID